MKPIITFFLIFYYCLNVQAQTAHFTVNPSAPHCTGITIYFTDLSTPPPGGGSIISRNWDFGDGTSSTAINPTHTYQALGIYTVMLTITGSNNMTNSSFVQIEVTGTGTNASFTYSINSQLMVSFENTSGNDITNSVWDFGDQTTETNMNADVTHNYATAGIYDVCLTVTNNQGCTDSICKTVNTNLANLTGYGIPNNSQLFYPNPSSGILYLNTTTDPLETVIIYNYSGQVMQTISDSKIAAVDISNLPVGVYYLTCISSENTMTQKIVKE